MRMPKALWLRMMVGLSLFNGCAASLHDGPVCSPFPVPKGQCRGSLGAACDQFLTPHQQILDKDQWEALQELWESQGYVPETTNSLYLSELKGELEKLCSLTACTVAQAAKVRSAIANVDRLIALAKRMNPYLNESAPD